MQANPKTALYNIKYSCISCITFIAIDFRKLDKSWTQLFQTTYEFPIAISEKLDHCHLALLSGSCHHNSTASTHIVISCFYFSDIDLKKIEFYSISTISSKLK